MNIAQQHGLRVQFRHGLISPASLDNPAERQKLDALVAQVHTHPALYSYFVRDEPGTGHFSDLGRLIAHLRERDLKHPAYINLYPIYAKNVELGTQGDAVTAYREHLRQYLDVVKPSLLSYDHYQFAAAGDGDLYFLNLSMIRQAAQQAGIPFINIVQAASFKWDPEMRVPNGDELRYLVYTTLAYGAQGISYYVYCCPGHTGGIALPDGTPTPAYHAIKSLNREFVAIATELQPLDSLGIYHAGMTPPGAIPLPKDASFYLDPPVASMPCEYLTSGRVPSSNNGRIMKPAKGVLLGYFGPGRQGSWTCQSDARARSQSGLQSRDRDNRDWAWEPGGLRCRHPQVVVGCCESGQASVAARWRQTGANMGITEYTCQVSLPTDYEERLLYYDSSPTSASCKIRNIVHDAGMKKLEGQQNLRLAQLSASPIRHEIGPSTAAARQAVSASVLSRQNVDRR